MNKMLKRKFSRTAIFCAAIASFAFAVVNCSTTPTEAAGNPHQTRVSDAMAFLEKTILDSTKAVKRANVGLSHMKKGAMNNAPASVPESQLHADARSTMHDGTYMNAQPMNEDTDFWKYGMLAIITIAFAGIALYLQKRSERAK